MFFIVLVAICQPLLKFDLIRSNDNLIRFSRIKTSTNQQISFQQIRVVDLLLPNYVLCEKSVTTLHLLIVTDNKQTPHKNTIITGTRYTQGVHIKDIDELLYSNQILGL